MLGQKVVNIGGEDFTIQHLPATKGIEAAVVLSQIVAGGAEGVGNHKKDFLDIEFNVAKIVAGIFKRLDEVRTPAFIRDLVLLSVIRPQLDSELYDVKFAGEYEKLVDLVIAIIEHNGFVDIIKKKVLAVIQES